MNRTTFLTPRCLFCIVRTLLFAATGFTLVGCSALPTQPPEEVVFRIEACEDQTFQVLIREPKVVAKA